MSTPGCEEQTPEAVVAVAHGDAVDLVHVAERDPLGRPVRLHEQVVGAQPGVLSARGLAVLFLGHQPEYWRSYAST